MAARARISAVLLAAGRSTRFGGDQPKQLYPWEGEPLVRRTARAALAAGFDELLVVVGHRSREVEAALAGMAVKVVANPRFAEGKASSVAAGLAAVSPRSAAAVFLPCDQPWLDTELLLGLAEAYRLTSAGSTGGGIVVPSFEGRRGAPVLFDR
ncbi:MAG TPA: nucleotidyltransferase family protein, partial [Thermoanaerobaculia bacterium]|nr:nucleotidyltransferase family protein [Thermoanaerobaculia bacterium]